jgi:hypothetical protein
MAVIELLVEESTEVVVMVMAMATVMVTATPMVPWGRIVVGVMVEDHTLDRMMTDSAEEAHHIVAGTW